jgi:hypothetical protein
MFDLYVMHNIKWTKMKQRQHKYIYSISGGTTLHIITQRYNFQHIEILLVGV